VKTFRGFFSSSEGNAQIPREDLKVVRVVVTFCAADFPEAMFLS